MPLSSPTSSPEGNSAAGSSSSRSGSGRMQTRRTATTTTRATTAAAATTSPPPADDDRQRQHLHYDRYVNRRIAKYFVCSDDEDDVDENQPSSSSSSSLYLGTVVRIDAVGTSPSSSSSSATKDLQLMPFVEYDDGDSEHVSWTELDRCLELYDDVHQKNNEVEDRQRLRPRRPEEWKKKAKEEQPKKKLSSSSGGPGGRALPSSSWPSSVSRKLRQRRRVTMSPTTSDNDGSSCSSRKRSTDRSQEEEEASQFEGVDPTTPSSERDDDEEDDDEEEDDDSAVVDQDDDEEEDDLTGSSFASAVENASPSSGPSKRKRCSTRLLKKYKANKPSSSSSSSSDDGDDSSSVEVLGVAKAGLSTSENTKEKKRRRGHGSDSKSTKKKKPKTRTAQAKAALESNLPGAAFLCDDETDFELSSSSDGHDDDDEEEDDDSSIEYDTDESELTTESNKGRKKHSAKFTIRREKWFETLPKRPKRLPRARKMEILQQITTGPADRALQLLLFNEGFQFKLLPHQFLAVRRVAGVPDDFPLHVGSKVAAAAASDEAATATGAADMKDAIKGLDLEVNRVDTKGVLIADEMGLGKTVEAIAGCVLRIAMAAVRGEPNRPTLMIAPNDAVLKQWVETLIVNGVSPTRVSVFRKAQVHADPCSSNTSNFVLLTRYTLQSEIKELFDYQIEYLNSCVLTRSLPPRSTSSLFPYAGPDLVLKLMYQYLDGKCELSKKLAQSVSKNKYRNTDPYESIDDCVTRLIRLCSIRMNRNNNDPIFETCIIDEAVSKGHISVFMV